MKDVIIKEILLILKVFAVLAFFIAFVEIAMNIFNYEKEDRMYFALLFIVSYVLINSKGD